MGPKNILITGANRGIGLEFVKQLLKLSPKHLIAGCREPEKAKELQEIAQAESALKVIKLDVQDEASVKEAKQQTEKILGREGLNVLINNAGIHPRCSSIQTINAEDMASTYRCNVIGPAIMCREFLPLLQRASFDGTYKAVRWERAAVVNISSILGSVAENNHKEHYHYGPTKAALNMFTKTLSLELKSAEILVVALHPGWVRTDMGGPHALISTPESVEGILKLLPTLKGSNSGKLYDYTGREMAW